MDNKDRKQNAITDIPMLLLSQKGDLSPLSPFRYFFRPVISLPPSPLTKKTGNCIFRQLSTLSYPLLISN